VWLGMGLESGCESLGNVHEGSISINSRGFLVPESSKASFDVTSLTRNVHSQEDKCCH